MVFRNDDATLFFALMDEPRLGGLPLSSAIVGFSPSLPGQSARLIAVALQLSGATITRQRLVPLTDGEATVEITDETPTPTAPISVTGGDVDGDGEADVVRVLLLGGTRAAPRGRLLVSLGVEVDGEPLPALSEELRIGASPRIALLDFDEDGDDDVLLFSETEINVLEMGAP